MREQAAITRRMALALAVILALVAGCGESEKDEFAEGYRPLNNRLLDLGSDLGSALRNAKGKSNRRLAEQFAGFGLKLRDMNKKLRGLDAPDELEDDAAVLSARIDDMVKNLESISGAAANNDPQGAAAATVELGTTAEALDRAQDKLARATGAKLGKT